MNARASPPVVSAPEATFTSSGVRADVQRGLLDEPPWLSSLYFYDEHGSGLFEQITETPEYYPTRTELSILEEHGDAILQAADADGQQLLLAELGSGSSAKTHALIRRLLQRQGPTTYVPVDVSGDFLATVAAKLEAEHQGLSVEPLAAEYVEGLRRIGQLPAGRRLVLFLGSSIGNFEPDEQVGLLRAAFDSLAPGDALLLGTDLVKDAAVLEAAYNDAAGVTTQFNRNIITRLNRELGGSNDIADWCHVAFWNAQQSRIEMHLEAVRETTLDFPDAEVRRTFQQGERIHTENSYKFTLEGAATMAEAAGWSLEQSWRDSQEWFALHLLRRS